MEGRHSLQQLTENFGYSRKQIWSWTKEGLLPEPKRINFGGKQGWQSLYPEEAIRRLKVFQHYKNLTGKEPGKTVGLEGLFHLLFACGFDSQEILERERELLEKGTRILQKEIKEDSNVIREVFSELIFLPLALEKGLLAFDEQNKELQNAQQNLFASLNPLLQIFIKGSARSFLSREEVNVSQLCSRVIYNLGDYLDAQMLSRMQSRGLLLLITMALGFPRIDKEKIEHLLEKLPEGLTELKQLQEKRRLVTNLPSFLKQMKELKTKVYDFALTLLHPDWAVIHLLITASNYEIEKYIKEVYGIYGNIPLIFNEKELEQIPSAPSVGVKRGKLQGIKLD